MNPGQNALEIGIVPTGFKAFGLDADLRRVFLTQQIETDVP
jgi:hypothetical protein